MKCALVSCDHQLLSVQGRESFAWNSVYFALDDETATGLGRLVAPASNAAATRSKRAGAPGGLLKHFCACGPDVQAEVPVAVSLELAGASGTFRKVDVPDNVVAIMVENLPKRWAKGDDFWDSGQSGVRCRPPLHSVQTPSA